MQSFPFLFFFFIMTSFMIPTFGVFEALTELSELIIHLLEAIREFLKHCLWFL